MVHQSFAVPDIVLVKVSPVFCFVIVQVLTMLPTNLKALFRRGQVRWLVNYIRVHAYQ